MPTLQDIKVSDCIGTARRMVVRLGPMLAASDDGPVGLAYAQANYEAMVGGSMCSCEHGRQEVYWRNNTTGSHGWMCRDCRRVTQVG